MRETEERLSVGSLVVMEDLGRAPETTEGREAPNERNNRTTEYRLRTQSIKSAGVFE